jgi:hypothetical protein
MSVASLARKWLPAALLVLTSTAVAVLLAEGGLRLALNSGDFLHASLVDDPVLGQRIAPGSPGHDALGYRNSAVPAQVRVVAIGDSNTYGVSAPREGSWPYQLQGLLGEPVYNMGLGGFGPLQYLHLSQTTARAMKPGVVVLGFYFGNDLLDATYMAHGRSHWQGWRQSATVPQALVGADTEPRRRFRGARDWLARNSMLYSVLRATVLQKFAAQERAHQVAQASPDVRWAWADPARPNVRTVFTPQMRLAALDLDRPPVREGLVISQRALAQMDVDLRGQGTRLIVLLIPTKERAYCRQLQGSGGTLPVALDRLCQAEASVKAELVSFLDAQRIAHVDVAPALEARIAEHAVLYPADADGHAVSAGYAVMAKVAADAIARLAPRP